MTENVLGACDYVPSCHRVTRTRTKKKMPSVVSKKLPFFFYSVTSRKIRSK
jgi:hypothetical protein